jgi:hypothetical protein
MHLGIEQKKFTLICNVIYKHWIYVSSLVQTTFINLNKHLNVIHPLKFNVQTYNNKIYEKKYACVLYIFKIIFH